ncbi:MULTISPECIES: S-adenosylmethionine decarboxylase family protein [Halolamina]|uniref:S-adenosylmethionine decarboxylase family protein n=1 Tax=Halolamina TaxID=1075397 RepID=UPI000943ED67|nr:MULTISPECIES: S-adenosylmethionine decarboxylase [Halolamina]NHX37618.1 hypothetical protein [Halolamina sp. R1-12]
MEDSQGEVHIYDIYGVDEKHVQDRVLVEGFLRNSCEEADLTVVGEKSHEFQSQGEGFSTVLLLAESHVAVHSWPEHDYMSLTIDTCWSSDRTIDFLGYFLDRLDYSSARSHTVGRSFEITDEPTGLE